MADLDDLKNKAQGVAEDAKAKARDVADDPEGAVEDAKAKAEDLKDAAQEKLADVRDASDGVSGNVGDGPAIDASGPVTDGFAGSPPPTSD